MKVHALRLAPSDDIRTELQNWCIEHHIEAASIVSAVGSIKKVKIRLANSNQFYISESPHEILTFSGLLSKSGLHIHLSVADGQGLVHGGHLVENNLVFTTLELVILQLTDFVFNRELDPITGYKELQILKK